MKEPLVKGAFYKDNEIRVYEGYAFEVDGEIVRCDCCSRRAYRMKDKIAACMHCEINLHSKCISGKVRIVKRPDSYSTPPWIDLPIYRTIRFMKQGI